MAVPVRWHAVSFDCPECGMPIEMIAEVCVSADGGLALRGTCGGTCGEFIAEMMLEQLVDSCHEIDKAACMALEEMPTSGIH